MARLPYLQKSDLAPEDKDLLERDINLARLTAHSPKGARANNHLAMYIRHQSRLDPRLREMALLQVGYLARSEYEYAHHIQLGREFGVSDDDIRAIAAETAGRPSSLEPLAKTVLRAAREMTTDLAISNETFAALKAGLDNERIVDLILAISFYNGVVRTLASLKIDLEDSYRHYLDEFTLPKN